MEEILVIALLSSKFCSGFGNFLLQISIHDHLLLFSLSFDKLLL